MFKKSHDADTRHRPKRALGFALALVAGAIGLGGGGAARAASLDGAGRIMILPYVLSGLDRESTIYITNPGQRTIKVLAMYVGAEGTPMAASRVGVQYCAATNLGPGEARQSSLSQLCPLSTPDVENFGYLELITYGGFDTNPFYVTSIVDTKSGAQFGVEGFPIGALDPGRDVAQRATALRVAGLEGQVPAVPTMPVDTMVHCYIGALGEAKQITVQLMQSTGGFGPATPLGNPQSVYLTPWTMVKLSNLLASSGAPANTFTNVTAEFYAAALAGGADVIAGCSVEMLAGKTEDFRMATAPAPNDRSRSRVPVRGDNAAVVGPVKVGMSMVRGTNVRFAVYLRHEDYARCRIVPSSVAPQENPAPWQELRVINPDGVVVAGGPGINDTGTFYTGAKNAVGRGVNGKWVVEVSWIGTPPAGYPPAPVYPGAFGFLCESTSGMATLIPLPLAPDTF